MALHVCTVHRGNKLSKLADKVQVCIYSGEEKKFKNDDIATQRLCIKYCGHGINYTA